MNRKVMSEHLELNLWEIPDKEVRSKKLTLPYNSKVLQVTNDDDGPKLWVEFDFNHEFSVERTTTIWVAQSDCMYFPKEATTYLGSFHDTYITYGDVKLEYYWHVYSDGSLTRV